MVPRCESGGQSPYLCPGVSELAVRPARDKVTVTLTRLECLTDGELRLVRRRALEAGRIIGRQDEEPVSGHEAFYHVGDDTGVGDIDLVVVNARHAAVG